MPDDCKLKLRRELMNFVVSICGAFRRGWLQKSAKSVKLNSVFSEGLIHGNKSLQKCCLRVRATGLTYLKAFCQWLHGLCLDQKPEQPPRATLCVE